MSELLVKATLERPKDAKDRADQRLAQVQAASEGAQGRMGGEPMCCRGNKLGECITTSDSYPIWTEGMEVLSGSPPAVFVADKPGAARIETEGKSRCACLSVFALFYHQSY